MRCPICGKRHKAVKGFPYLKPNEKRAAQERAKNRSYKKDAAFRQMIHDRINGD